MENKRRRQQKVKYMFFEVLKTNPTYSMAIRCIKSIYSCKNKFEDNKHRGQVKEMEVCRTYPTNGQ